MRNILSWASGKRYTGTCILHMILYLSIDTVSLPTWSAEQKNKVFSGVRSAIFLFQSGLSKGMHNFLKVSDFRKCSSFPKYKFVMTTSTENMKMNASFFFKKSAISKNHHKFYFSVHLTSYTNLMSHFSRAFINCFPNIITLTKQWI